MRLNAYLARAGVASRRKADELIKAGLVKVNGKPGELNTKVSEKDKVEVGGKPILLQEFRYILLNKPPKTITTLKDPEGRAKVTDLINIPHRVVPVGRLDYDTTGALLLTNDGELAHKLMHPSFEIKKVYEADIKGEITEGKIKELEKGVKLEDGLTAPAKAKKLAENKIEVSIHEGRKHQVKHMLAAVGLPVQKLHRSIYAGLSVDDLQPGEWRELTKPDVEKLKMIQ
jgi:23S rRNA pseudouridine2605 synthase